MGNSKIAECVKLVALAVLAAPVGALGQPASLVASGAVRTIPESFASKRTPVWSGNALVVGEGPSSEPAAFVAFDRTGAVVFNAALSIPEAAHNRVDNWARGNDGTVAACGWSFARDGSAAPFIAWFSPDGDSEHLIRTEPYGPTLIAIAPDGTFWTVGHEQNSRLSEKGANLDAGVVRHFDRSGKTLGAFIPRSSFQVQDVIQINVNSGFLVASADRTGWFHYSHIDGSGAYVEISAAGEITSYPIPQLPALKSLSVEGIAMTDSGDVFVRMIDLGVRPWHPYMFRLNRPARQWFPVALPPTIAPEDIGELFGASGSKLVFVQPGASKTLVRFFKLAPGS
jgi:hypothetical protein